MCGRARCTLRPDQIAAACGIAGSDGNDSSVQMLHMDRFRPSYNVAPGAYMPVVRRQRGGEGSGEGEAALVIHCMKWGLVPSFTKKTEKPDHYKMFNARSESIREKASFRRLIPHNRCLVAVEGFYEWKKDGSKRQPYYIHFKDHRPLLFAALYDSWENPEGEILYTFTILTTRSSTTLQWLHDRMPVILENKGSTDAWVDNSVPKLETLLVPYEDDDLVWYPLTPAVGKISFDGPECIKEVKLKPSGENLISKFFTKKAADEGQPKPQQKTLSEKSLQTDALHGSEKESGVEDTGDDKVKKEPAFEATKESGVEDTGKPNHSTMVKKENKEPEKCGIKREYEELATDNVLTAETVDSTPSSPVKKKERNLKNTGDKQASLLSYFGKA